MGTDMDVDGFVDSFFSELDTSRDSLELLILFHDFMLFNYVDGGIANFVKGLGSAGFSSKVLDSIKRKKNDTADYETIFPDLFSAVTTLATFLALANLAKKSLDVLRSHQEELSPVLDMCPSVRKHLAHMGVIIQSDLDGCGDGKGNC